MASKTPNYDFSIGSVASLIITKSCTFMC